MRSISIRTELRRGGALRSGSRALEVDLEVDLKVLNVCYVIIALINALPRIKLAVMRFVMSDAKDIAKFI